MPRFRRYFVSFLTCAACLACVVLLSTFIAWRVPAKAEETRPAPIEIDVEDILKKYVETPDESYGWKVRQQGNAGPVEWVELTLTSQTWHGHVWKHQLFLLKPSTVAKENRHALLFIGGGDWRDEFDQPIENGGLTGEAAALATVAEQIKTPIAILRQVPFQPMIEGRREDALIALTFTRVLTSGDPTWALLLPMVKSAARAMDAAQEYAREKWELPIDSFTVTGASKRGWTTWLTAATDKRVQAFAPMVIDMLNLREHLKHQVATWGRYSEQLSDYTERGLQLVLETEEGGKLHHVIDPYSYRDGLRQPKLIVMGTNDRYWPLDSLNLYWDDLHGPKYILYVPNNGHGINDYPRLVGSLNALHQSIANGVKLPKLEWEFKREGDAICLYVTSDQAPQKVQCWTANSETRDFRPAQWTAADAKKTDTGYRYEFPMPQEGYAALFGEAVYEIDGIPAYFSTNVRILEKE